MWVSGSMAPLPAGGATPELPHGEHGLSEAWPHGADRGKAEAAGPGRRDKRRPGLLGTQMNVFICRNRMKSYLFT